MENLMIAILDRIESELCRCYYNKHQQYLQPPFKNNSSEYHNDLITIRAYNWDGNYEPNFECPWFKCWWYKHSHRGLYVEFDDSLYETIPSDTMFEKMFVSALKLGEALNKIIQSIIDDFESEE